VSFNFELQMWPAPTSRGVNWLTEAIANVREGLVPHLAAPTLSGRIPKRRRSFPTTSEYNAMPRGVRDDGATLLDALGEWGAARPRRDRTQGRNR
jgi:hypothetical protein